MCRCADVPLCGCVGGVVWVCGYVKVLLVYLERDLNVRDEFIHRKLYYIVYFG
jgi:hypothetical protein